MLTILRNVLIYVVFVGIPALAFAALSWPIAWRVYPMLP